MVEDEQILHFRLPYCEEIALFFDVTVFERRVEEWRAQLPEVVPFFSVKSNSLVPVRDLSALWEAGKLGGFACASRFECEKLLTSNSSVAAEGVIYHHAVQHASHLARAKELGVSLVSVATVRELDAVLAGHPSAKLLVRLPVFGHKRGTSPEDKAVALFTAIKERGLSCHGLLFDLVGQHQLHRPALSAQHFVQALASAQQLVQLAHDNFGFKLELIDLGEGLSSHNLQEFATKARDAVAALTAAQVRVSAQPSLFFTESAQITAFQLTEVNGDAVVSERLAANLPRLQQVNKYAYTKGSARSFNLFSYADQQEQEEDSAVVKVELPADIRSGDWVAFSQTGAYTSDLLAAQVSPNGLFVFHSDKLLHGKKPASPAAVEQAAGTILITFEGIAIDRATNQDTTFSVSKHLGMIATGATTASTEGLPFAMSYPNGVTVNISARTPLSATSGSETRDPFALVDLLIAFPEGTALTVENLSFVEPLLYRTIGWFHPDTIFYSIRGTNAAHSSLADILASPLQREKAAPWLVPRIFSPRDTPVFTAGDQWHFTQSLKYDAERPDRVWAMENLDDVAAGSEKYAYGVSVRRMLYETRSDFQQIIMFDSTQFGRCMMLDGHLQFSEADECSYQEMLCHIPICSHPDAKRVLIVGGGDLFCAREVLRYPSVEEVVNVEIDSVVTRLCSWFMVDTNNVRHNQPRFHLVHDDAAHWVDAHHATSQFDVIIVDSSDPTESSPAAVLYRQPFLGQLFNMLSPEGVLSYQGETFWDYASFILKFMNTLRGLFPEVRHATSQIPTYPNGQIGYTIARKSPRQAGEPGLETPRRPPPSSGLKFYTPELHTASFALPLFVHTHLYPTSSSSSSTESEQQTH